MGPGAPGFARAYPIAYTGKLSLAHATRPITYFGALVIRAAEGWYSARLGDNIRIAVYVPRADGEKEAAPSAFGRPRVVIRLTSEEASVVRKIGYPSVLMFGGPGSGKGTQGVIIGKMPNLVHLAMGDIFRGLDKKSDIGQEFLSHSTKGQLVPDELTVRVFRHHVEQEIKAGAIDPTYHTLILDGIPRTTEQVKLLVDVVEVKRIVYLVIRDHDALIARLIGRATKSHRPDDADREVILNRIEVYERETAPVLDAYPKKLIARVNGDQPPLAVLRDVAECLIGCVSPRI